MRHKVRCRGQEHDKGRRKPGCPITTISNEKNEKRTDRKKRDHREKKEGQKYSSGKKIKKNVINEEKGT